MIRPHVPELRMPEGHDRDRMMALRALRNCGVIRVTIGKVPRGYRLLQKDGAVHAKLIPGTEQADCRLTPAGLYLAGTRLLFFPKETR